MFPEALKYLELFRTLLIKSEEPVLNQDFYISRINKTEPD